MKKIFILFISLLGLTTANAQDISDAYRYSSSELTGTARFRAMSGAFSALGGDISAMSLNPASSAVFLNSFATVSFDFRNSKNDVNYFNGFSSSKDDNFDLNQAGAALVFNAQNNSDWRKFAIGINYGTTNNYDDSFFASGTGNNSIDNYFLGYADGVPLDLLQTRDNESVADLYSYLGQNEGFGAQQAMLGYQAYIINPTNPDDLQNDTYTSTIAPGSFDQQYSYISTGLNGKFTFNFSTQFQDFLYLGANLNIHSLSYDSSTLYTENNSNSGSETNEVRFRNDLSTNGDGFSFQVGAIAKLSEMLRLGASYQSPTWYNINEESSQSLQSYSQEFDDRTVVNPNVLNVYPEYTLQTPGKLTGGLAVLFGDRGLLSFDYSYKDYTQMEFRPVSDSEFAYQNEQINNNMRAASTYRVGGEYRFGPVSLRGGYRFEESPFENTTTVGDLTGYSAGLGYNFGALKLDVAYTNAQFDEKRPLYQVGLTDTTNISRELSSVVVSLSFGL